ncbi:MAG: GDP-mannose 4,6-dehydratase [Candidatus Omnitrophica bacterium]|nr:GDP-mannose 4,6-dehydratase [Candidatus Omnitrophota bacterium]
MNWKNKKVLVTGAEGFVGSHLVEGLLSKGAKVKAFVLYNSFNSWGWLDALVPGKLKKIEVILGDIRNPQSVNNAVSGTDMVFHLAALIGIPFSYHSQDMYVDTNIKGTLNVLQSARAFNLEKMVHTSTSEVYGTAQYVPMDEEHPIVPQSPYAATKAAADYLALSFYKSFNLPVTTLRPFNTFGPRQSARAVIPTIISQVLSGKNKLTLGNIKTTRDFNFVSNIVDAFIKVAETKTTDGQIYNAASAEDISIENLVKLIMKILNRKITIVQERSRLRPGKSEVMQLLGDYSKLNQAIGWKPKVSLEQGLRQTCDWIKSNLDKYKPRIYNI